MNQDTLDKINALTRRDFTENEIYTFPVTLCHNDIDRDGERFSDTALEQMAKLFIGKTGIFDHNPTADNQAARIYDTEVVTDAEKLTQDGRPFKFLKGYAYMVRTSENADFILEIDAGIKKEVSVSCASEKKLCSVCGKEAGHCKHVKGKAYDGKICCHILDNIKDAYEWSFVAVPAQQGAGVTKNYHQKGEITMNADFKPITTQADFDAAVQPLIDAAVSAKATEFADWISPESHKSALLEQYRSKAAVLCGLPAELADRLTGDTEEAIQKDAEMLASLTKSRQTPVFRAENAELSGVEKYFYQKNPNLKTRKENF